MGEQIKMMYEVSLEQFKRCLKSSMVRGKKREVMREVLYFFEDADLHMIHKTSAGHLLRTVYRSEDIEAEAERTHLQPSDVLSNFFNQYLLYGIEINGIE